MSVTDGSVNPSSRYGCSVHPESNAAAAGRRGTAEVRHALIEAGAALFAVKGYEGTGTKQIATAARTSETTLFRQFGSKSALFGAAVLEPFSEFLNEYEAFFSRVMAESEWTDRVITRSCVEGLYRSFRKNRNSILAMVSVHGDVESSQPAEAASNRLATFFDALEVIGHRRWEFDPGTDSPEHMGLNQRFMVSIVFTVSALDGWFLPGGTRRPDDEELIDAITDFVLRGVIGRVDEAPEPTDESAILDSLERLTALYTAGHLNELEFSVAKARMLSLPSPTAEPV